MIKMVGRRNRRVYYILAGVFVMMLVFSFLVLKFKNNDEVSAADLGKFNPGYIISDFQMSDYNSMSEAEIQNFLRAKNPCGNTNFGYYQQLAANPNYRWHFENGHFICLSEERFGNNDNEIGFQYGESAAHIIWQAAQDYKINPKAIIVLLQKETGLITDPIPNNGDYRKATGYGCPDTAACSSQYYGFKNQVRNAVALFRTVLDGGWTNYPVGNNYVQYNPNAACGGSVINIQNRATSALYRYTPYQPNAGALAAGYGTAPCGAYGNRNFYQYFEDWFGGITMEASYVRLDSPRYFELAKETSRINPYTGEVVDTLEGGMIRKYDSKIRITSGEWCLRTEYSTANNSDSCIKMSDLKEIKFDYENIDEKRIITSKAKKTRMRSGDKAMGFSEYLVRRFVKKTTFMGATYYITEFDSNNNGSEYGIDEKDLLEGTYSDFGETKEYVLKNDAERVEPFTGMVYDVLKKGRIIKFAAEIEANGKKYYQTENNNINGIDAAVSVDNLVSPEEYDYESFINPREMVLLKTTNRVNPFTGEVYDTLEKGRVIKFASKIYINGVWYYRTENNTTNDINAVISSEVIGEK